MVKNIVCSIVLLAVTNLVFAGDPEVPDIKYDLGTYKPLPPEPAEEQEYTFKLKPTWQLDRLGIVYEPGDVSSVSENITEILKQCKPGSLLTFLNALDKAYNKGLYNLIEVNGYQVILGTLEDFAKNNNYSHDFIWKKQLVRTEKGNLRTYAFNIEVMFRTSVSMAKWKDKLQSKFFVMDLYGFFLQTPHECGVRVKTQSIAPTTARPRTYQYSVTVDVNLTPPNDKTSAEYRRHVAEEVIVTRLVVLKNRY